MPVLKQAFRSLRKSPGFALIAGFILTIAIGANLAVFATIDAFLLRPLPVDRPDELARICAVEEHGRLGQLPSPMLQPLGNNPAFHGVCGVNTSLLPAEFDGNLRSIGLAGFTGGCFGTLGIGLEAGRGAFGVLALILAAAGLFGLLSYRVANRRSEIGICMALGAQRVQIQSMVLRHITGLLLAGTGAGIALTLALERVARGLLFGVGATSFGILGFSVAMLAVAAALAAWIPVQRATRIDPLHALRHE
jgi:hypothetical protein